MRLRDVWRDSSLSAILAGFVTVLVGFTSSAALVFQAGHALGATAAQMASWMWALGIGMGITCIVLSLRYRVPVVTAWSTPGAAMLITSAAGVPMAEAIGAFIVCALLMALSGFSGWFERALKRIPLSLASGMLAGVLLRFGLDVFVSLQHALAMVLSMCVVYLLGRRFLPRYAVILALVVGTVIAAVQGQLHFERFAFAVALPVWIEPSFSLSAMIGIALPLFMVTMASQNIPGVAVIRASGYEAPISPLIGWISTVTLLLAPFGAYALNLAAITAAICMGREAHEDSQRRYVAAVAAGVFYLLIGVFGATVAALFSALPKTLILAIAGLALLGTIGNGLATAMRDEQEREAALITFLVTASGLTLWGIGSAFWGLVVGGVASLVLHTQPRRIEAK